MDRTYHIDWKRGQRMVNMLVVAFFTLSSSLFMSCSDMLETSSELVEFEKNNTLDHPTDSVYSVMGQCIYLMSI